MENLKNFYEKYRVYLTRPHLEIVAVVTIVFCAVLVFLLNIPGKGVLKLDNGSLVYDGSLVRGKMNGQGTITFSNGDTYTGAFTNGAFNGKGTFQSKEGWVYEGDFVNGQAEGQGKLTTEQEVVYEGNFKQGVFQQKQ
ncbi:MORN repeat-containing protein [Streptococcus pneumoniae]|uniref:MORN repeat-containing protein n=1 Tax=Streptococcus pneumoniae TaxID=1313 RepID=UPI0005E3E3EE|nr:MORN repeat-containing protein [Streptococcus pneumoniae]CJO80209.1 morn motif family protein [Streptococcus pneumoniae]CJQ57211.1 morn motif family protein [Streptococcus pneumoniae]